MKNSSDCCRTEGLLVEREIFLDFWKMARDLLLVNLKREGQLGSFKIPFRCDFRSLLSPSGCEIDVSGIDGTKQGAIEIGEQSMK